MIPFRERARLYGYAVCSFVQQKGPVYLLDEMLGNIGDHLIWAGTTRLLDTHLVSYARLPMPALIREPDTWRGGTLLVPGSAAWTTYWHEWLPSLIAGASTAFERVVVLPSSYDVSVPVVLDVLSRPNVYAFVREVDSYRRIKSLGRATLALDAALYAMDLTPPDLARSREDTGGSALVALRTDKESRLGKDGWRPVDSLNDDISVTTRSLAAFLERIRSADVIVSDRLHVVVSAVMLGKSVHFVDPSRSKISSYVDYAFRDEFEGQLVQHDEQWLAAQGFVERLDR